MMYSIPYTDILSSDYPYGPITSTGEVVENGEDYWREIRRVSIGDFQNIISGIATFHIQDVFPRGEDVWETADLLEGDDDGWGMWIGWFDDFGFTCGPVDECVPTTSYSHIFFPQGRI